MVVQYELSQATAKQAPLFNYVDIHHILTSNLGLRLSHRPDEITDGGFGDTIPLSHLGGAKESIQFVTLSALILRNPNLDPLIRQQHLQTLNQIFETFAGHDHENFKYAPALMLAYASLLNISSVQLDPKLFERRLPENEETILIKLHTMTQSTLFPVFVFDRESNYYADLPSLRLHLTSDFNQLLEKRLVLNSVYYSAKTMVYLLITNVQTRFKTAYDLSHYPLGKTGSAGFTKEDILGHVTVSDKTLPPIWAWLKQHCTLTPTSRLTTPPEVYYAQQCMQYCQDNKVYMAGLLGAGLFAGYKLLQNLQEDHTPPQPSL
ncbi:MAG: hypothetical protein WCR08_07015 [Gammaproteobacteria bacterium]